MSERRMFAKTIIDSDAFLEMPLSTQALYFHLSMRADDEGFINNPRKIQRMIGAADDDLRILTAKSFIIPFESGIVVIKHWKIHNYIRGDRLHETKYTEERALLKTKENGAYTLDLNPADGCQSIDGQVTATLDTEVRLGEVRLDEVRLERESKSRAFTPPTLDEVAEYCRERHNNVEPARFIDFYESKGWFVGKNKMKDWKAAVRTWEQRDKEKPKPSKALDYSQRQYSEADINAIERKKLGLA